MPGFDFKFKTAAALALAAIRLWKAHWQIISSSTLVSALVELLWTELLARFILFFAYFVS